MENASQQLAQSQQAPQGPWAQKAQAQQQPPLVVEEQRVDRDELRAAHDLGELVRRQRRGPPRVGAVAVAVVAADAQDDGALLLHGRVALGALADITFQELDSKLLN